MKINLVLMTSTSIALLGLVGSALSADLPAKKTAAAAASSGCPAFGAGFFQIPGSETCIKFYGYLRADYGLRSAANSTNAFNGRAQLAFQVNNNADIGAISSTARINNTATGLEEAYIQASGVTAGLKYSVMDYDWTTHTYTIGGSYTVNTLLYTAVIGDSNLSVGLESPVGSTAGSYYQYRPDVVAQLKTKVGPASFGLSANSTAPRAGAAELGAEGAGYGVTGSASIDAGTAKLTVYGGYGYGASRVSGTSITDFDGTNYSKNSTVAVKASIPAGNGTLNLTAAQNSSSTAATTAVTTTTNTYSLSYAISAAKNLVVTPELATQSNGTTTTNGGYLRIQRNF